MGGQGLCGFFCLFVSGFFFLGQSLSVLEEDIKWTDKDDVFSLLNILY